MIGHICCLTFPQTARGDWSTRTYFFTLFSCAYSLAHCISSIPLVVNHNDCTPMQDPENLWDLGMFLWICRIYLPLMWLVA
jgi:hypothetical protein